MTDRVRDACEACFETHKDDCSEFLRAVAGQLGVTLNGNADKIVETIRNGNEWKPLLNGAEAAREAAAGKFCVGGLKGSELAHPQQHVHVVVVVAGELERGLYPHAFWGQLNGIGKKDETTNYAWRQGDRDHVSYAAHDIVATSPLAIG
jgi:hypothetical protein